MKPHEILFPLEQNFFKSNTLQKVLTEYCFLKRVKFDDMLIIIIRKGIIFKYISLKVYFHRG